VIEIMDKSGVTIDIFKVHDHNEIARCGVLQTLALKINAQRNMGRPSAEPLKNSRDGCGNHQVPHDLI
jgi:hypothetical protein